jgi:hypothetical protein
MESTPEIAAALDIYAEECVSSDANGNVLHIHSDNRKIQEILEGLFYEILNVDFNLVMWVRNVVKYGDFFIFNDVSPEFGVINAFPISISEIEREEGFDPDDPAAVRFRWVTQGNQVLENWQVTHFRLLGNDAFLPYGSSVLESARRIWRQLILIEDAMLVYRVIRAPERRVFKIDVGNVPPEDVGNYLEQAKTSLKRNQIVDKDTGRVDLRYNPMSVDEDYFLPVRGGDSGTSIETLAGGTNTSAIEDVEYIQKKLFAALKIPRAYLGYDEDVGSKATLAQEDIRFSRTIQRIQKTIVAELNKLAMIHLYSHGYEDEDLIDFSLKLSNPSSVAQQQKLELIRAKFEIAGTAPEGLVDRDWIRRNVLELSDQEIENIEKGKIEDKIRDSEVEGAAEAAAGGGAEAGGGEEAGGEEAGGEDLFAADVTDGPLLTAMPGTGNEPEEEIDDDDEIDLSRISIEDLDAPLKIQNRIRNVFNEPIKKSRRNRSGPGSTHMPDMLKMTSTGRAGRRQDTLNKPFDDDFVKNPFGEALFPSNPTMDEFIDSGIMQNNKMTREMASVIHNLQGAFSVEGTSILNEDVDSSIEGGDDLDMEISDIEENKE